VALLQLEMVSYGVVEYAHRRSAGRLRKG
jgi:hypothetical protein